MVKKFKNGWCYRFDIYDAFGKRYRPFQSGFKSKKEAEDAESWARQNKDIVLEKMKLKQGNNTHITTFNRENLNSGITFSNFYDFYLKSCTEMGYAAVTLEQKEDMYEFISKNIPELLNMKLGEINEFHLQPVINLCPTACKAHDMYKFLHAMFEFAIKKRVLRENVSEFLNKRKYVAKKKDYLGLDYAKQLLFLLKSQNNKLYTPVLLALLGGVTREEVPPLLESKLDNENYTIKFDLAMVKTKKRGNIVGKQKTKNRERIFYANKEIFEELHWFKRTNNINSEYLCCNIDGSQMLPKTLEGAFYKFIKKSGLKHCTFHQLRTILSDGQETLGYDINITANTLGHGDTRVTQQHYKTDNVELRRKAAIDMFKNMT